MNRARRGFTVVESCVAAALLGAALAISVALFTSVARQRQAAGRHARAVLMADNLLARITAEPYESLSAERALEICNEAGGTPSQAAATIAEIAGSPPGKKITVALDWQPHGQGPPARHQVATWVFQPEDQP